MLPESRWNDSHPKPYIKISQGSQNSAVKFSLWKSPRNLPSTKPWCTAFVVSPVPGHWPGSGLLSVMVGESRDGQVWVRVWVQVPVRLRGRLVRFHTSLAVAPPGPWETRHQPRRGREAWRSSIKQHLTSKHCGIFVLMLLRVQWTKRRPTNLIWSFLLPWDAAEVDGRRHDCSFNCRKQEWLQGLLSKGGQRRRGFPSWQLGAYCMTSACVYQHVCQASLYQLFVLVAVN